MPTPTQKRFRWRNFRSFKDTGAFAVRPLTILIGANAAGKSAIHSPLMLLKQSAEAVDESIALKTRGDIVDFGEYRDFVHMGETDREIEFEIEFHRHVRSHEEEAGPVGRERPGRLTVSFGSKPDLPNSVLTTYTVHDEYGRRMLSRNLLQAGIYSLKGPFSEAAKPRSTDDEIQRHVRSAIRNSQPWNFLFSDRDVSRTLFRELAERGENGDTRLSDETGFYLNAVSFIHFRTLELLESTAYVGPLRARPQRWYTLSSESPQDVGATGAHTAELIARSSDSVRQRLQEELARFGYRASLESREYESGRFALVLRSTDGHVFNYADAGFGISQLLPVLYQGLTPATPSELLIAEQPEIHLNPKLQAQLGTFFAEVSKESSVIVETHSEHLLLRVRRLVAAGDLDPADVALYFVEMGGDGASHIRQVPIKGNGAIDPEEWPKGFFGDSTAEAVAITKAQLEQTAKRPR